MKSILDILSMFGFSFIFDWITKLIKKYFYNTYINLVDHLRSIFFIGLWTFLALMLIFSGFLFCHVALFLYLPISNPDKAILLLALGIFYILIAILLLVRLHSRERWHKISGIKKIADEPANNKKE